MGTRMVTPTVMMFVLMRSLPLTATISQSGQLTTTLKSTPMISTSFVMQIDLKIVMNGVTQKISNAKVTV